MLSRFGHSPRAPQYSVEEVSNQVIEMATLLTPTVIYLAIRLQPMCIKNMCFPNPQNPAHPAR
jgi:hypothetical protein